jgi:hypothetical protein
MVRKEEVEVWCSCSAIRLLKLGCREIPHSSDGYFSQNSNREPAPPVCSSSEALTSHFTLLLFSAALRCWTFLGNLSPNPLRPCSYFRHHKPQDYKIIRPAHTVYWCFLWFSEHTAVISTHSINWPVFLNPDGVCSLVGTSCILKCTSS